jgi:hypothetical protein
MSSTHSSVNGLADKRTGHVFGAMDYSLRIRSPSSADRSTRISGVTAWRH